MQVDDYDLSQIGSVQNYCFLSRHIFDSELSFIFKFDLLKFWVLELLEYILIKRGFFKRYNTEINRSQQLDKIIPLIFLILYETNDDWIGFIGSRLAREKFAGASGNTIFPFQLLNWQFHRRIACLHHVFHFGWKRVIYYWICSKKLF